MSESASRKELPESIEAEVSVLGAMLLDSGSIDLIAPYLRPEAFAHESHKIIYQTILDLHNERHGVDLVTVGDSLKRAKRLDKIGGLPYLAQLVDAVPSAANVEHYAHIVRERHVQRDLISAANAILDRAQAGELDGRQLLDDAQKRIFDIAEDGAHRQVAEIKDILKQTFDKIDRWRERGQRHTGLETGFYDLDDLTSGFQPAELIVLAARPSVGKTSFALSIVENVGVKQQKPIVLFSLEMAQEQIARNLLCAHARIDSHRLRRGALSQSELTRLGNAAGGPLAEAPIFIDDSPGLNLFEIRSKARRLRAQRRIELVIIDYLQLMDPPKVESREQQVSQISRGLKSLARELGIPVVALAQLNRAVEMRDDHRPRLADLRESGAIEQDADVVMLLHRPAMYRRFDAPPDEPGAEALAESAELHIAKQRNGPTGQVNLTFLKNCMRFDNASKIQEEG